MERRWICILRWNDEITVMFGACCIWRIGVHIAGGHEMMCIELESGSILELMSRSRLRVEYRHESSHRRIWRGRMMEVCIYSHTKNAVNHILIFPVSYDL